VEGRVAGWSVYGAKQPQPVATGRKWDRRESGSNRREPFPWVATDCHGKCHGKEGSTVRVRQRAYTKFLQMGISCRLLVQHAGTRRVHLWYSRRRATSRGAF